MADQFDREDVEAVADCLGDDPDLVLADCRALLAAHAAASTDGAALAVDPLPMASAPKDGRPILAWSTYNVYAFIVRFDRELEDFEDNNGFSVRNLIGWWPLPIRKEKA